MIDFHAHILPGVDDGSKSVNESVAMLSAMKEHGIKRVIATPHFYANDESTDSFVARRFAAYEKLMEANPSAPEIMLGAEVKYYEGISHLPDLKKLRIEGSRLLLLEMPFNRWTEYAVSEVVGIASRGKVTVVLAHIDRYLPFMRSGVLERLHESGVLFQVNSSFFKGFMSASKAVKLVKRNYVHFIGSDCHNLTDRAPDAWRALETIEKKLGTAFAEEYTDYVDELFAQNRIV